MQRLALICMRRASNERLAHREKGVLLIFTGRSHYDRNSTQGKFDELSELNAVKSRRNHGRRTQTAGDEWVIHKSLADADNGRVYGKSGV